MTHYPMCPVLYQQCLLHIISHQKKLKKHYTIAQTIVFAKTGEFLLGFYEDTTVARFEFFKICKENGPENSEFEREIENKRVQEKQNREEREVIEKDETT